MAHFIGVVHRRQALIAQAEGFVSFARGARAPVARLAVGDTVIYYAPKSDFDGEPVQAFVAHATVTGEDVEERAFGDHGTGHIRRAAYREVREVPIRPMIPDLDLLRDRKNWGGVFRAGKVEIGAGDYERLVRALMGGG